MYHIIYISSLLLIGETLEDLSFNAGTTLTLLEPCKEMYWYVAVNSKGKRGTVPVTYLEVGSGII